MSNTLICHGGSAPLNATVTTSGTLVYTTIPNRDKYLVITNPSSVGVYLALYSGLAGDNPVTNNLAEVGKGIYLAPEVGVFELNNVNMYYGQIWGITASGTANVCLQVGR